MKFLVIIVLTTVLILSGGISQAVVVIDFEDWSGGSGLPVISGGFDFHGNVTVFADPTSSNPTNALHSLESTFKAHELGGGLFTIQRLDLHEGMGAADTVSIRLVGSFPHPGGQVIQTFNLDGDPATYETFYPAAFIGIADVHFYGLNAQGQGSTGGLSVDNIVVPEPGMLGFALLCLAGIWRRCRAFT